MQTVGQTVQKVHFADGTGERDRQLRFFGI